MTRKSSSLGVVVAQGVVDVVDRTGKVLSSIPITPEKVIDLVELQDDPSQRTVQVKSLTTGTTLTMGYTPAYGEGYERAFGPKRRTQSREPSRN